MTDTKQKVREFYDNVGWQQEDDGLYQNARYDDLRPVAAEYVHKTRLRIKNVIAPAGRFFLDAGSGPVQYDEYLAYSEGYQHRVCFDISIQALSEARKRIGSHGLFVVGDIANLPFEADAFEAVVSMHTIHHLPVDEHKRAYLELFRVLAPGKSIAVVNGWGYAPLTSFLRPFVRLGKAVRFALNGKKFNLWKKNTGLSDDDEPVGTFINKTSAKWLRDELRGSLEYNIIAWRSLNVHFMRTFIHTGLGGRYFLRMVYWLEEKFPRYFGENGQYPLIIFRKA